MDDWLFSCEYVSAYPCVSVCVSAFTSAVMSLYVGVSLLLCKCTSTYVSFSTFQLKLRCGSAEELNGKCPSRRCVAWDETVGFKLLLVLYQHIIPCWLTSLTVGDISFSFCSNKRKRTRKLDMLSFSKASIRVNINTSVSPGCKYVHDPRWSEDHYWFELKLMMTHIYKLDLFKPQNYTYPEMQLVKSRYWYDTRALF